MGGKNMLWKSKGPINSMVTFFCVQQNKEIYTGLEQLDGE